MMCDAVLVDGERIENLGVLAAKLSTPMRLHPAVAWTLGDEDGDCCLCCADIPRMAIEAGYAYKESDDVWISYELTTNKGNHEQEDQQSS